EDLNRELRALESQLPHTKMQLTFPTHHEFLEISSGALMMKLLPFPSQLVQRSPYFHSESVRWNRASQLETGGHPSGGFGLRSTVSVVPLPVWNANPHEGISPDAPIELVNMTMTGEIAHDADMHDPVAFRHRQRAPSGVDDLLLGLYDEGTRSDRMAEAAAQEQDLGQALLGRAPQHVPRNQPLPRFLFHPSEPCVLAVSRRNDPGGYSDFEADVGSGSSDDAVQLRVYFPRPKPHVAPVQRMTRRSSRAAETVWAGGMVNSDKSGIQNSPRAIREYPLSHHDSDPPSIQTHDPRRSVVDSGEIIAPDYHMSHALQAALLRHSMTKLKYGSTNLAVMDSHVSITEFYLEAGYVDGQDAYHLEIATKIWAALGRKMSTTNAGDTALLAKLFAACWRLAVHQQQATAMQKWRKRYEHAASKSDHAIAPEELHYLTVASLYLEEGPDKTCRPELPFTLEQFSKCSPRLQWQIISLYNHMSGCYMAERNTLARKKDGMLESRYAISRDMMLRIDLAALDLLNEAQLHPSPLQAKLMEHAAALTLRISNQYAAQNAHGETLALLDERWALVHRILAQSRQSQDAMPDHEVDLSYEPLDDPRLQTQRPSGSGWAASRISWIRRMQARAAAGQTKRTTKTRHT
ncbi:hypothetical protein CXG81DRAFT_20581, partial [Caulochytrium protostelioides]